MPWEIKKSGKKFLVVKEGTNKVVGTHSSRDAAVRQQRALYANTAYGRKR